MSLKAKMNALDDDQRRKNILQSGRNFYGKLRFQTGGILRGLSTFCVSLECLLTIGQ